MAQQPMTLEDGRCWNGLAYVHNAPVAGCKCGSCVGWFPQRGIVPAATVESSTQEGITDHSGSADKPAVSRQPDYLEVAGKKFARTKSLLVDSLFHTDGTCCGIFKLKHSRGRVAIELRNLQDEPIALVSPDGCLVTAARLSSGKTFYMFAMTEETKRILGMESTSYSDERAIGKALIAQFTGHSGSEPRPRALVEPDAVDIPAAPLD